MLEKFFALMIAGTKRDDKGATATEYGLLVGLIALIIVVGVAVFGDALNHIFQGLGTTVSGW